MKHKFCNQTKDRMNIIMSEASYLIKLQQIGCHLKKIIKKDQVSVLATNPLK